MQVVLTGGSGLNSLDPDKIRSVLEDTIGTNYDITINVGTATQPTRQRRGRRRGLLAVVEEEDPWRMLEEEVPPPPPVYDLPPFVAAWAASKDAEAVAGSSTVAGDLSDETLQPLFKYGRISSQSCADPSNQMRVPIYIFVQVRREVFIGRLALTQRAS